MHQNIDAIDEKIVTLLAVRGGHVRRAAAFKKTTADVEVLQQVEAVVEKVRRLAKE